MNLVLFESTELGCPLPKADRRARHVLEVLRRQIGETFDAGIVNGPRGKATITAISSAEIDFSFAPATPLASASPITLVVGLPRPQTARDILRDATTIGVAALHFVRTERAESSYAQSSLWTSGEWRRQVLAGAEQAFDTRLPEVSHGRTLSEVLASLPPSARCALDNYESATPLAKTPIVPGQSVALAIGAERGWSPAERDALRAHGFTLVHLGSRVLRTETAVIAALTLVHAKLASPA